MSGAALHRIITKTTLASVMMLGAQSAQATELNAGFVLDQMNADQRVSYVAGVVEGLAYARFLKDRPDDTGMMCVYDWYSIHGTDEARWNRIKTWLRRHEDKPVGVLMHTLIKQECGE